MMNRLYCAAQVRALDRLAIEHHGIPGYDLMNRAGDAVFRTLRSRWPEARALTVCCGGGNNGGDGYVIARLAREAGMTVQLIGLKAIEALSGDAARAARDWLQSGGGVESLDERLRGDVIVDALLGTGLDRPAEGDYARLIAHINDAEQPVIAVDIPSGLAADTGMPLGPCVVADCTVTFIGNKRGLWTGQAGRWCGVRSFDDLLTPAEIHEVTVADARLLSSTDIDGWLRPRPVDAHKGDLGHVLIIGGDQGMAGAPVLTGQAALGAGSGLVSLATRAEHASVAVAIQPELMAHGVEALPALDALIGKADVVALGPGLGQSDWSKAVWLRALQSGRPLVLDADGLNLLAVQGLRARRWVLTPHPGEAARLLHCNVDDIQADRFAAVRTLAERYQATVVLKGHGSLVASPEGEVVVCPFGNPAMATAGMGDALTGIIASLVGQGLSDFDAASCGVLAHALAGDRAACGRRQILATDLIASLPRVLPA